MKLGLRILISFLLVFGLGLYYLTHGMLENVRFRYLEGVEDSLVDHARIFSSLVSLEMENRSFSSEKLHQVFDNTYKASFSAQVYKFKKTTVDLRVYITDNKGIVVFDSKRRVKKGTDYSKWRDVSLTLKGEYGARSSREDMENPDTAILYVAAPIIVNEDIAGVLTVAKPTTNINNFLVYAKSQITKRSIIAGFFVVVFCISIMLLAARPIKLLTQYAVDIREGKKVELPKLDRTEIGEMGRAFEKMREALEGKKYVENYVQTLTHEIKSPISAIQGASELLEEEMPAASRLRFLQNIQNESRRIQRLVDRMLALSSIENLKTLKKKETINLKILVDSLRERMMPMISKKQLKLENDLKDDVSIQGDPFLIKQVISNLIQNAVDFSPSNSHIRISSTRDERFVHVSIKDQGPGVPDYAKEKIFEKFFSLQRPDSGKKSTGLGLNFVKEVAILHNGAIKLENCDNKGVCATLSLPLYIDA